MIEIEKDLPKIPYIFISSYKKYGLEHLKGILWEKLNEINKNGSFMDY